MGKCGVPDGFERHPARGQVVRGSYVRVVLLTFDITRRSKIAELDVSKSLSDLRGARKQTKKNTQVAGGMGASSISIAVGLLEHEQHATLLA